MGKKSPLEPPQQVEMFPDSCLLHRIIPEENMWRFYSMNIEPDLFGGAVLVREYGRIGSSGQRRQERFDDAGQAAQALAGHMRRKVKRGYRIVREGSRDWPHML